LHAVFGVLLQVVQHWRSRYMTLGLAEPLNYGLSMPPGQLKREMGDAEAFCSS